MSALPSRSRDFTETRGPRLVTDQAAELEPVVAAAPRARLGIVEWFCPGEHARAEQALADLQALGVRHLRTGLSWADCCTPAGLEWYDWLIPRLAERVELLPCLHYTPPSLSLPPSESRKSRDESDGLSRCGSEGQSRRAAWILETRSQSSPPPQDLTRYGDLVSLVLDRYGRHFEYVELCNGPNRGSARNRTPDRLWLTFLQMIGAAARAVHGRGWKTVLGGMSPTDANWLRLLFPAEVMRHIDVVGFHGFPGARQSAWEGWDSYVERIQRELDEHGSGAQIWITETGLSTWRHNEFEQLEALADLLDAPVPRAYWYSLHDLDPALPAADGFHSDEREYHFGLKRADGTPKLLYRIWAERGLRGVQEAVETCARPRRPLAERPVAITGGCGFIGTNLAHRLASSGRTVLIIDNLSRPGVEANLQWLQETHGERIRVEVADVRDPFALHGLGRASHVFHLAVTASPINPVQDFEVNVHGTLNLLETLRSLPEPPPLLFASTHKVYGSLPEVALAENEARYEPEDEHTLTCGIGEQRSLDFHSPYGCSKGAADQYVLTYARTFGLPAAVFRMSCIYGPHQYGGEDQGWVAHCLLRALEDEPVTLSGDGKQVQDVLFVEDLVEAMLLAQDHMAEISGQAFNIGGGPANTLSLLELIDLIGALHGQRPAVRFEAWRPGDQRYYVSDTREFSSLTGWAPRVRAPEGVSRLYRWLLEARAPSPSLIPFTKAAP